MDHVSWIMSTVTETSDSQLLDLLRLHGALSVTEMASHMEVTATAVRQRLTRLMGQGLVQREASKAGRGRPSHHYSITEKARRQAGTNFADLALVMWDEIRAIKDPDVRRGLLSRMANNLAERYRGDVAGATLVARMDAVKELFEQRGIGMTVDRTGPLPVLTALSCPYPDLAEKDRSICALENMLFSELLATRVHLAECRLDGHACCRFETSAEKTPMTVERA